MKPQNNPTSPPESREGPIFLSGEKTPKITLHGILIDILMLGLTFQRPIILALVGLVIGSVSGYKIAGVILGFLVGLLIL